MSRVLTTCLAALALIVAGCGGGDDSSNKEDYEQQVRSVGQTLQKTFEDLGTSISGSGSTEQAADRLGEGAESLDKAASDLDAIEPPSEISEQHDQLVAGMNALADDFREGAKAAEDGNLEQLLEFAQNLQTSEAVQQITEAGNEIEAKGYNFTGGEDGDGGNGGSGEGGDGGAE